MRNINYDHKMLVEKEQIIEDLRVKLAEKEEILAALSSGKADAIVVKDDKGNKNIVTLKGAEVTYQLLVESMNEGALTVVEDGTIIYCNKRLCEILKLPRNQIINTKIYKYIHPAKVGELKELITNLSQDGVKKVFQIKASDNTSKKVLISSKCLNRQSMNAVSMVLSDLSELDEAEQRYKALVENAYCGFCMLDEDGTIVECNKRLVEILGYKKEKILGENLKSFFPIEELAPIKAAFDELQHKKRFGPDEFKLQRANEEIREVVMSITHITFGGRKLLLGFFSDITEVNRFRTQAIFNDKLSLIGTLSSGIVHEINNPMTWVMTNLDYIGKGLQKLVEKDDEAKNAVVLKLIEATMECLDGINRIKDITHNLKSFTHADDKQNTQFDCNQLIDSVIKMAYPQFKNSVVLEKNLDANLPRIFSNRNKLHQVVLNLIINAAQAMDENKPEKKIIIESLLSNHQVSIKVIDNGKGISSKQLKKIFLPFYTTKPAGVGTGLGLFLCDQIMKSIGGTIEVESQVNQGSTFTIRIPFIEGENISKTKQLEVV